MSTATHTALQSNSNPKGVLATAEGLLVDGVMHYEAGDVHRALARWREVLVIDPAHSVASRYTQFVETHFQVTAASSVAEVRAAQERVRRGLVGEPAPVAQQSMLVMPGTEAAALLAAAAAGVSPAEPASASSSPEPARQEPPKPTAPASSPSSARPARQAQPAPAQAPGVASEDPTLWASLPSSAAVVEVVSPSAARPVAEEEVTAPPKPVPLPVSEIARRAISGPAGPSTQADGLSIQALSRQLSELHRSGKYEQAVATARELLEKDPQHAVARRYIEEYNRQKQAALARQRTARQARGEAPEPSASPAAPSPTPMRTASYSNAATPSAPSTLAYADDSEDVPTAAPVEVAPPAALLPEDLAQTPRVLVPIDQISWREFDHRAGFFVSQVDGGTSYDDLIAISGMSRDEAVALLTKLIQRGVIGV